MLTIGYINFWIRSNEIQDNWFTNYLKYNIDKNIIEINIHENPDILIASCMGDINNINKIKSKIKIFFYGENLNRYPPYNNIKLLQKYFDLIVGFKYTNKNNKIYRLPLWLIYYPYYSYDKKDNIFKYIQDQHDKNIKLNKKGCSLISKHDRGGQKILLYNEISKYIDVYCPGKFKNNIKKIGNSCKNKIDFIKTTIYNICTENSCYEGYFTEKIFHAFEAGCIPIYWGVDLPEKNIINKNSYCFININKNIDAQIQDLIYNNKKYNMTDIFKEEADNIINTYYNDLKNAILNLL